jgi:hypothetical protein
MLLAAGRALDFIAMGRRPCWIVSSEPEILAENLERETGIEPATSGLGSRCSTIELLPPRTASQKIIPRHCT